MWRTQRSLFFTWRNQFTRTWSYIWRISASGLTHLQIQGGSSTFCSNNCTTEGALQIMDKNHCSKTGWSGTSWTVYRISSRTTIWIAEFLNVCETLHYIWLLSLQTSRMNPGPTWHPVGMCLPPWRLRVVRRPSVCPSVSPSVLVNAMCQEHLEGISSNLAHGWTD